MRISGKLHQANHAANYLLEEQVLELFELSNSILFNGICMVVNPLCNLFKILFAALGFILVVLHLFILIFDIKAVLGGALYSHPHLRVLFVGVLSESHR